MVDIDHRQRVIKVKLVYYGPAVGGKTTNLKVLFERAAGAGAASSSRSTPPRTARSCATSCRCARAGFAATT